jgi:hypothetical protein
MGLVNTKKRRRYSGDSLALLFAMRNTTLSEIITLAKTPRTKPTARPVNARPTVLLEKSYRALNKVERVVKIINYISRKQQKYDIQHQK